MCHCTFCNSNDNIWTIKMCWVASVHYNSKLQLKPNCKPTCKTPIFSQCWKEGKTCFESIFPKVKFHINSLLIYFQVWCNNFFGFFVNIDFILNFCAFRCMDNFIMIKSNFFNFFDFYHGINVCVHYYFNQGIGQHLLDNYIYNSIPLSLVVHSNMKLK